MLAVAQDTAQGTPALTAVLLLPECQGCSRRIHIQLPEVCHGIHMQCLVTCRACMLAMTVRMSSDLLLQGFKKQFTMPSGFDGRDQAP